MKLHKKVSIPAFLHEVHGEQASVFDLLIVYASAVIATVIILYLAWDVPIETYKMVILAALALDLAGGVVANFTKGTNTYYAERPKTRYVFIGFHVVQPLLFAWIFPSDVIGIALISVYTLIAVALINNMGDYLRQRVLGAFLLVLGLTTSFVVGILQPVVHIMLMLFMVKLIMAFAVRWR